MLKSDYDERIRNMLGDSNIYKVISTDPTETLERKNNVWVETLFKLGIFNKIIKEKLFSNNAVAPRLYGVPKTHKLNNPLRPIVNSINCPSYQLSKYIGQILNTVLSKEYNVQNSYELKSILYDITIPEGYVIVSYDVVNLFTCVPIHKINAVILKKWQSISNHTTIPQKMFLQIINFCVSRCNYFSNNNTIYFQLDGVAMGNPLAPTLANLLMDDLFEETLQKMQEKPILFIKYVDDCLAIIKSDEKMNVLNRLNNYHPNIRFTMEEEHEGSINFLDIQVIHVYEEKKIITNWYMRSIASGRVINYKSIHPKIHKQNIVKEMINRVTKLSDEKFEGQNLDKVIDILKKNDYPQWFINKFIKRDNQNVKITISPPTEDKIKYRSLTYFQGLSENLVFLFRKYLINTKIAFKMSKSVGKLFTPLKDTIPTENQSGVVYKIECNECNAVYVGQTERNLRVRVKEHKNGCKNGVPYNTANIIPPPPNSITRTGPRPNTPSKQIFIKRANALVLHSKEKNHSFDFQNVKILGKETNENKRLILETIEIIRHRNACNLKTDLDILNSTYLDLIKKNGYFV